jgi:nitric oxide reductase large subunit
MITSGVLMYRGRAPIPERVHAPGVRTLFTAAEIQQGRSFSASAT